MKKSIVAVFSISIIMLCLVFLMWMNAKGIDMPFGKEEISKEVLMNTEYKELKIGEDTMVYPSFLDIKSESDDCVELESDDKTVVMTFKRYKLIRIDSYSRLYKNRRGYKKIICIKK